MRRLLICLVTLTGLLAVPTAAGAGERDRPTPDPQPVEARDTDAKRADVVRPADVKPRPEREALRLECVGSLNDAGEPGIGCNWSEAKGATAAAYVLYRGTGDERIAIFRTDGLANTRFVDFDVKVGVRYRYKVVVLNAEGNKVGASRATTAGVAPPEPEIEALDLKCEAIEAAESDGQGANCRWSATSTRTAVGYQLWRAVDRDARELVWRGGLDTNHYADRLPASAQLVSYAVLAVDADGEIVARSRAVQVRFEHDRPEPTDKRKPSDVGDKPRDVPKPSDVGDKPRDVPSRTDVSDEAQPTNAPAPTPTDAAPVATDAALPTSESPPDSARDLARSVFERLAAMLGMF